MGIVYITRVNVPGGGAQSVQINAMARAFSSILGNGFKLVCGYSTALKATTPDYRKVEMSGGSRQRYFIACCKALEALAEDRSTIIFTRDIAVALVVILFGGKAIYESHKSPIGHFSRFATRFLCRSPRFKLVCISEALSCFYQKTYLVPASRLLTAHSGVFANEYQALRCRSKGEIRAELGLPMDAVLVVHTGSLYKGGAELYEHIAKIDLLGIYFVHVGGSLKEINEWTTYYADRSLDNVKFVPNVSAEVVRSYQRAADLLFYVSTLNSPIWWCTSPLKLFEYMASGTPILGSCIGSVSEVLNDGNAFCYEPNNIDSIERAFNDFRGNAEEASRRSSRALTEAINQYSWINRAARIAKFAGFPIDTQLSATWRSG